ncbi:MAG: SDR family oxidoreductase [Candidatus Limiplasma sp.]|nr:SDR family oxidoreductase [Candidatus Limiplasma sp.]
MKKSVLITGSSHGIGAACAEAFAKEGYDVGINYCNSPDGAMEVAEKCRALGADAQVYKADVSKREDCEAMLNAFIDHFGKIDVLVNNAGGALKMPKGGFVDMPMEYWDSQINLNLNSAAYCSHVAARDMVEKGVHGAIINISSVHSLVTWVKRKALPYSAGKAGLNMFTKSIGVELIKYGINVNAIAPGLVYTKIMSRYSDRDIEGFNRKIPIGHGGQPEDIVPMVLFLADKEKSRFIVGQTIFIDGGQTIDGAIDCMLEDEF